MRQVTYHCDKCNNRIPPSSVTSLKGGREAPKAGALDLCPERIGAALAVLGLIVDPDGPEARPLLAQANGR